MQAVITDRLIKSLKPDARPYEVRDGKLRGFILRVQPSGVMSFICQYRRGKRETLGKVGELTVVKARKSVHEILAAERGDGYVPKKKRIEGDISTLGLFIEKEYVPYYKLHGKPPYKNLNNLKTFAPYYDKKLEAIDERLIGRWSAKMIAKGRAKSTVKRYLNALHAVLSLAVKWGVIEKHPLRNMKSIKTDDNSRPRYLEDAEEIRLLRALDEREERKRSEREGGNAWRKARGDSLLPDLRKQPFADYLKPIVLLAKNTGMRKGEILALKWSDIDFNNAILTVRWLTAKNEKTRYIPINSTALGILKAWRSQSNKDLVFPCGDFKSAWKAVLNAADIQNFVFHGLRHDFASRLVMAGADLKTVQELLGHADMTMTLRYAHLSPGHKAAAVELLTGNKEVK